MTGSSPEFPVLLGLDVGTSDSKVLATTVSGREIGSVSMPTRWRNHGGAFTDADPQQLVAGVFSLLAQAVEAATAQVGAVAVRAIAVTGMAEAGVLLDEADQPVHPIIAWFDPRGGAEILDLPTNLLAEFSGRTGLPVSPLATIAKLAWMRGQGTVLRGKQWLNVPEYLVHRLGGRRASEMSLAARTGLLDQDSERLWPEALAALGATSDLIPPLVVAGTPLGRVSGPDVPEALRGAVLTIAGHDHPVAAVGCGVTGAGEIFDSFGTAEALVRSVDGILDSSARHRLAVGGVNAVHHVLAGRRLLLGGTKAGLILRRALDMLGANGDRRSELDEAACALATQADKAESLATEGIGVSGAANDDGTLRVTVTTDAVSPAAVWLAALENGVEEANRCLDLMSTEIGAGDSVVVAGGWIRMQSVRMCKQASLQNVRFSERSQASAFGATMFAAHAADVADRLPLDGGLPAGSPFPQSGPTEEFVACYTGAPAREDAHPDRMALHLSTNTETAL